MRLLIVVSLLLVTASSAFAQARPALCLVEIAGTHHLGGDCSFLPTDKSGSFEVTSTDGALVARVVVTKKDEGLLSLKTAQQDKAKELGEVSRANGCWVLFGDVEGYVCAWGARDAMYVGPTPHPKEENIIFYGSRVGMFSDIASRKGLDTAQASIVVKPSHDGAVVVCREYSRDFTKRCIDQALRSQRATTLMADCRARTFANFNGGHYRFMGRNTQRKDISADYLIRDVKSGETLDGSTASGYDVMLGIFQAACPASVK